MREVRMNNIGVINNPYQHMEDFKRVITVCSAACLRAPTAAVVLSQDPFNFNTRAVGLNDEYAIVQLDDILVEWADEFVVMEQWMAERIRSRYEDVSNGKSALNIHVLDIPDRFAYRDPELMKMIHDRYLEVNSEQ